VATTWLAATDVHRPHWEYHMIKQAGALRRFGGQPADAGSRRRNQASTLLLGSVARSTTRNPCRSYHDKFDSWVVSRYAGRPSRSTLSRIGRIRADPMPVPWRVGS